MIIVPDQGAVRLLSRTLKGFTPSATDLALRLFKNDYTPGPSTILGSFEECTFGGYMRKWLASSAWSSPVTAQGKASSTYTENPLRWTATSGGQTVFGYYVEEAPTAVVVWCERLQTPRVVVAGGVLDLTLIFTGRTAA